MLRSTKGYTLIMVLIFMQISLLTGFASLSASTLNLRSAKMKAANKEGGIK